MFSMVALAETRVAVIDSGYNYSKNVRLCNDGHYDITTNTKSIGDDVRDHGTKIAKIISNYAVDYCIVVIKVFTRTGNFSIADGLQKALEADVDVINLSLAGYGYNKDEVRLLWILKNRGVQIFVASGNDGIDLNKSCVVYPACYAGLKLHVVSNTSKKSNKGDVVTMIESECEEAICGTSISTAIATGKYIRSLK